MGESTGSDAQPYKYNGKELDRLVMSRHLVSDYLTDRKKSLAEKQQQTVVADATGRIVWLVGERPDNRFRIATDTKNILRLDYEMIYKGIIPSYKFHRIK